MTANDPWQSLTDLLDSGQTPFVDRVILGPGLAFHYTTHGNAIERAGALRGAPVDRNIGCTQAGLTSPPADDPRGVLFAYENLEDARSEGPPACDIFRVRYTRAISAVHSEEAALAEAAMDSLRDAHGTELSEAEEGAFRTPRTIIVLVDDIEEFSRDV